MEELDDYKDISPRETELLMETEEIKQQNDNICNESKQANSNHTYNNDNIVSIIGNRVVLIPSISSLQNDLFKQKHNNNLRRSKTVAMHMHMQSQSSTNDLASFYCLNGKKRRLRNSNLKRARTTFEPRHQKKQIKPINTKSLTATQIQIQMQMQMQTQTYNNQNDQINTDNNINNQINQPLITP
eukprot:162514_1